jgi:hypothetical protein
MTTHHNKLTETLDHQLTDSKNKPKKGKKQVIAGTIVFLLIILSPFIFYLYKSFPDDSQVWETSFFTIETIFPSMFVFAWYVVNKLIPLFLLLIWFFTCKHWWYWAILAPIGMYVFQLWSIIEESNNIDEVELLFLYPFMFILMPALFLIRAHLLDSLRGRDLEQLEKDLRKKRTLWGQVMDLFN